MKEEALSLIPQKHKGWATTIDNKQGHPGEGTFLETRNLLRLNHEKTEKFNIPVMNTKIKLVIKSLLK